MFLKFSKLVLLVLIVFYISSCKEDKKVIEQVEVTFTKEGELELFKTNTDSTKIKIDIEIASSDYEIQTGLMYRNSMENNQGMLFVFDDSRPRSFFMKNTRIPLDLIFLDEEKRIVSFQKNAKPFDESSLPSNAPARYVLEVNAGLVDYWNLSVGDRVSYKTMPE